MAFEEKSVWIQLVGTLVGPGGLRRVGRDDGLPGDVPLAAYVPVFALAVALTVVILFAGLVLAAIGGGGRSVTSAAG